jgi:hypothetical protein
MITGMLLVILHCGIPVLIIGINNILSRKRYLLCGKQKQSIENFRRGQERRKDSEKKREWQYCFFCPVSWAWYF